MSQLILEFHLPPATIDGRYIVVELGNGVHLTSVAPEWLARINETKLQIIMEVDGSPNANTGETSVE